MGKLGRGLVLIWTLLPLIAPPAGAGLLHSTFVGGEWYDTAMDVARDDAGAVVVTGWTDSSDFPFTPGAYDPSPPSDTFYDLYVLKLSPDLSALIASTFVGGSDNDMFLAGGRCLALDGAGNPLIAGKTNSDDFPITPDAFDPTFNGSSGAYYDGFVLKLSADLGSLLHSSFVGGTSVDACYALTLDAASRVILVGTTSSEDFPVPLWAFQPQNHGGSDAFIFRLSPDLRVLQGATFIGGSSYEEAYDVTLDGQGRIVVVGHTFSNDFPTTSGAYDTSRNGGFDFFVLKMSRDTRELVASTYLGGTGYDYGRAVEVDEEGGIWVLGDSRSADFPTTPGAFDASYNGGEEEGDLVVGRLSPDLSALEASTFLGGAGDEYGEDLAIDGFGDAWVTGWARWGFPMTVGADPATVVSGFNVCLSKLSADLDLLLYSALFGGTEWDVPQALTIDAGGNLLLAGYTSSTDFPVTVEAYDTTFNDEFATDAFIAVLDSSTLGTSLACTPGTGTLPFTCQIGVALVNQTRFDRRGEVRLDLQLANGTQIMNWRSLVRELEPGESFITYYNQPLPVWAALVGENLIHLTSMDITPPPYNQPPYPPSGDSATGVCTMTAAAP